MLQETGLFTETADTICATALLPAAYTCILYRPVLISLIQPSAWLPFLFNVSVYCTLPDDTSSTVHPVSVLNEVNKHSKHTLPPVVSVIKTDSTP